MIANTLISTSKFAMHSNIGGNESKLKSNTAALPDVKSQLCGYLSSIELRRNKIIDDLSVYYNFKTQNQELSFLEKNPQLIDFLPQVSKYIKTKLDAKAVLSLELLSESSDWETLFINISTKMDWESTNTFIDLFFDDLYTLFPKFIDKLNISIIPQ